MKNRLSIIMAIAGLLFSCSSDMETGNVSRLTYFPIITMNGDAELLVPFDSTFEDPGATADAGGSSVEVVTSASGTYQGADGVDTSVPDNYLVTYSAQNDDGFDGTAIRNVWVANTGDLVNSIEGLYLANVQRAPDFEALPQYNDMNYVLIWQTNDGTATYEISHALGGYYDFGRGYGAGYAARGAVITANDIPSNDFTISQAVFPIWGNTVDITDLQVDPENKEITFTGTGNFGNGVFQVQLTQVQF
ncbi:BT_2262 family domain-containing protein [Flagellimonas sp.]|uniref:BT_2262 family domain-containing protein n=1 Tax=Flagellimonas sp. TaxID=2058762 RepID=UPI003BB15C2D